MGKCSRCGKPASEGSDLCGFCKVNKNKPAKAKEYDVVADKKVFNKYDDVKEEVKPIKKEVEESKTISKITGFDSYDDVKVVNRVKTGSSDDDDSSIGIGSGRGIGISSISGIAVATMVFLIVLTVYGQIQSSLNTSAMGIGGLGVTGTAISSMISIIPLVLVGVAIIGIITTAFRLSI